jgi:hypothetical protein
MNGDQETSVKGIFHSCPRCGSETISIRTLDHQLQETCDKCFFLANYVKFTPCNHCKPDAFATCPHGDGGTPTSTKCFIPDVG